ncbi:hypothetical protein H2200_006894 [Cladophialophora chaetospira]|uniref:Uncharacterized protein n=1 Tax=Cladophialophora chaetospira TaxID=386627 RepID=A0AA38X926_9EURO|nr:hypothetical protein H2200_006894 [Cladophialophora chaetospira]
MSSYDAADQLEKSNADHNEIERVRTKGGHIDDRTQPALPVVHRTFANPAPLGLLSFATGIFLISAYGVHARNIHTPNVLVAMIIFFGGVCQYISGIMEFISGNTFGATVFSSYGAFNVAYAMIFLPGSGIIAAYTDPKTGEISPEFNQAVAMFIWAWFILTVIYTGACCRASWVLFLDLAFLDLDLALLACGNMYGKDSLLVAGNSVGFVVAFLSYWAGIAGLYGGGVTPFNIPTFPMPWAEKND